MVLQLLLCLLTVSCYSVKGEFESEWKFSALTINVTDSCNAAIQRLSQLEVNDPQLMAYYWDSWGKPSDGILTGHTTFLGYFDECINLKNTALGRTMYCIYSMTMETNNLSSNSASSKGVCPSAGCSAPVNMSSLTDIKVGVCYPLQCTSKEFAVVLNNFKYSVETTSPFSKKTNSYDVTYRITNDSPAFCPDIDEELDIGAVAVIIVCGTLIGLVIVGTAIDSLLNKILKGRQMLVNDSTKDKNFNKLNMLQIDQLTIRDLMLTFSLYNTVPKLISTKQSTSSIKGLSAIKVFFNFLIVLHHLHYYTIFMFSSSMTSQNSSYYLDAAFSRFIFQPIMNITFSVDAFFLVSATLSAYLTFKDMEKHKHFRCKYFYINRFLRLSPMYYLFTFIAYKLYVHLGKGPIWFSHDYHACPKTWWYNILYLTNTLAYSDMCMPETWYISADVQLFVLSPVFIVLLYHSVYYGLIAIVITMTAATMLVGFLAANNGYFAAILVDPKAQDQYEKLYNAPFYRINTYFTGIVLGYILYKKYSIATLPIGKRLKQLIYFALWSIAIYLCTVPTLFGTYGEYNRTHHFTDFENITFLMFSGLAFSIGLSIIIYICNTGYGGMFNSFISWPGWDPMSRLIYGVLLTHMMVMFYILGTLQSSMKYTDPVFMMISVFTLVISYGLSAVTAVCVELPIANIIFLCFKVAGIKVRSA